IQSPPVLGVEALVRKLTTPSGGWDIPLIRSSFSGEEVEAILSIPLSQQGEDSLLYHYGKDDNYSVRSGYKLGMSLLSIHEPLGLEDSGWWSLIWKLKIRPKAACVLEEFKSVKLNDSSCSASPTVSSNLAVKWMLPLVGFYKVNTDATVIGDQQQIGVGVIIRDANGRIMVSSTHWFATSFSPPVAEMSTILKGLQTVISFGYLPVILESDAKWGMDLIN
ncbi:hypothetical protein Ddye_009563, partial [Dipteronia dyeriana]